MIRLPAALERKLAELYPRIRERERFASKVIEDALDNVDTGIMQDAPQSIGGTLHLFTDGGSRGNPGQAAIGCILEDASTGTVLDERSEAIGVETNNVAEYKALIAGLEMAREYHPNRLICHLDSELVVKQVNGQYQVRMPTLKPFLEEIQALANELSDVIFMHIPREDNYRADALVNKALDNNSAQGQSYPPPRYTPPQRNLPF